MLQINIIKFSVSKRKSTKNKIHPLNLKKLKTQTFKFFNGKRLLVKLFRNWIMILFDIFYVILFLFILYLLLLICYPVIKSKVSSTVLIMIFAVILFLLIISYGNVLLNFYLNFYLDFSSEKFIFNNINTFLGFSITPLSFFFSFLVITIGFSTNIYLLNYFKHEADESLFVFWLNSFIFSMIFLVLGSNFYTIFLGWELIGLSSFFLINFWSTRRGTLKSSLKAFTFNLASDIFLLTSFVCFYKEYNTSDCEVFLNLVYNTTQISNTLVIGSLFLLLCASIKSVQIISHIWLPDSMEAPVPASALIHSATLVSAGIYLICKFNLLFVLLNWTQFLVFVGSLTACYGGIVASSQTDLKKLLAYSTMSHCGFLWVLASLGNTYITILYLFLHGLFKASTFYCVGTFIYQFGTQDSRLMGSTTKIFSLDTLLLLFMSSNLSGLPLTVGYLYKFFFFKLLTYDILNLFSIILLLLGMLSSLIYFFRVTYYTLFDYYKIIKNNSVYYTQFVSKEITSKIRFINFNNFLAVLFILIISAVAGFFFVNMLSYSFNDVNFEYFFYFKLNNLTNIYIVYYIVFYFLYILFFGIIFVVTFRKNVFFNENIIWLIYLIILVLVKCGVILWQKLVQLQTLTLVSLHINLIY